eukprot:TRINITY_DN892_c0_g1_i2.p3 TRINITY_DN892_c0_g1~~TRINITY_DN892_c0_g1_i2.p3  ORF type:complete len:87 (+),score=17.85 TRINITY_DN892_c0_g1_i2:436-696(+)
MDRVINERIPTNRKISFDTRNAWDDPAKSEFLVFTRESISNQTTLLICNYIADDYCFFDFKPPPECEAMVQERCEELIDKYQGEDR